MLTNQMSIAQTDPEIISSEGDYLIDGSRTLYDNVEMIIGGDIIIDSIMSITITNSILEVGGDIDIRSDGNTITNNDIAVNTIGSNYGWGIFFRSSSNNILQGNTIEQFEGTEVIRVGSIINNVFYTESDNNVINDNYILAPDDILDTFATTGNTFRNNIIEAKGEVKGTVELTTANGWIVSENKGDFGLVVESGSDYVTVTDNLFSLSSRIGCTEQCNIIGNTFNNTNGGDWSVILSAYRYADATVYFSSNIIENFVNVQGFEGALVLNGEWTNASIQENKFNVNFGKEIHVRDSSNVRIIDNTGITNITGAPFIHLLHGSEVVTSGMNISEDIKIIMEGTMENVVVEVNEQEYIAKDGIIYLDDLSVGVNKIRFSVNGTQNEFFTNSVEVNVTEQNKFSTISGEVNVNLIIVIPLLFGIPVIIYFRKKNNVV